MYLGVNKNRGTITLATLLVIIFISFSYFDLSGFITTAEIMERRFNSPFLEKKYRTVQPSIQTGFSGVSSTWESTSMTLKGKQFRNKAITTNPQNNDVVTRYVSKLMELKFNFSDPACDNTIKIKHFSHFSTQAVNSCFNNYTMDYRKGQGIWVGHRAKIRWTHHCYLTNKSVILDIGGNTGLDAKNIISRFHPKLYIILEPVRFYYEHLIRKFSREKGVLVLQFGAGANNAIHNVSIAGKNGDATSIYIKQNVNKTTTIQTFNITEIFIALQWKCLYEFDLVTINCEGCEFEVLEELGKTNVLKFIKNIQFATHTKLHYLKDPITRYCRIQELLSKTHTLSYQYKFVWESWKRKDLLV